MASETVAVMWFRRDLRLSDNPALAEAARDHDRVVALFVLDHRLWGPAGPNRRWFLAGCLRGLRASTDGNLVIRGGSPAVAVASVAAEVGAAAVYCAEDFGPYGTARDHAVERALADAGSELRRVGSPYAVPPGTVFGSSGEPYKVFSPFARAWRAHGWPDPLRPTRPRWVEGVATDPMPEVGEPSVALPEPGEDAAGRRLEAFLDAGVHEYHDRRNYPGRDATSRLSPYLKWGCLHPRQALGRLGRGQGEETFATELCWRDFYADVLFARPDTVRHAFNRTMEAMEIDTGVAADERFAAWCAGRTGFPIVDAGMRQLRGEGWMHNRVRMIVASFLVKDLHLDWTRGAAFFMEHLVDADLASNQHGWQWTAGTGTDPAPYFRVFNPVVQSRRFDPDGSYIRRWVPELAAVDGDAVHEPWVTDGGLFERTDDYPRPIVEHDVERVEALSRYQDLRRR